MTPIGVSKLTIIGSDNGLVPGQCQAIIWTNARILLIRTLGTNVSEINTFYSREMYLKMPSVKWRQFCLGVNVLGYNRIDCGVCMLAPQVAAEWDQLHLALAMFGRDGTVDSKNRELSAFLQIALSDRRHCYRGWVVYQVYGTSIKCHILKKSNTIINVANAALSQHLD